MKTASLSVEHREQGNKSLNRALRREARVPAVVYGPDGENLFCSFDDREIRRAFHGHLNANTIVTLHSPDTKLNGKRVILKDIQRHPVNWQTEHIDFYEISDKRALVLKVPLELKGIPVGVKIGGGILQVIRREVMIKGFPQDIPESIEVDISGLELNRSLHVSDIKAPEGITIVDSGAFTVAAVNEPEKEEAPVVAAAAAEGAAGEGAATATGTAAAAPSAGGAADAKAKPEETKGKK